MVYWISTVLICVTLAASAYSYLFHGGTIAGVKELGFPDHFRIQLAILKLLAVVVLLVPVIPVQAKDWAYAGAALFFVTAIVAHTAHGDPWTFNLINTLLLAVLLVSRFTFTAP